MTDSIVHLHNHTSYSLLDGAAKIEPLVQAAVADGQPALAITDHGNLYGLVDFYKTCKKHDIKPILGIEAYFCDDQAEKGGKKAVGADIDGTDKRYYHLTVLAENNKGYQNLLKLSSDAFLEGFYYKPRTSWDKLQEFHEGLIVTSGCLGGPVLQPLLHNNFDAALIAASRLQEIFGKDNFFIELQDHGIPEQHRTNPQLIEISRQLNAPTVVANDCHYVHHDDHVAHDSLLCIQTGSKIADEKRFRFQSDQHYLKTAEEMRYLFREIPTACDNTLWIADRADVSIDFDSLHLPVFAPPEGFESPIQYLTHLAHKGLRERYGEPTDEQYQRLAYELATMESLGLASYLLIVWDLCMFADSKEIRRGAARGSVAGCLVAYCLDISRVDPLRHNLLFERFINPSRIAMADIDLDFDTRYRDELITYTIHKYGSDRVAQIITFSKIRARAAVRDAAKVLGYEYRIGDRIAKAMPPLVMGEVTPLSACFERNPRWEIGYSNAEGLRNMYNADPDVKKIVDVAKGLEDLIRQDSVHAAAVVITPTALTDYLPIQQKPLKGGGLGPVVTQYEKNTIEELGLLKMDYLGLRNLDVISECLKIIGFDPGIDSTSFDDLNTFNLLRTGQTVGVFQLESKPMRQLLIKMQPTSIDDIAAVIALYRPGPMGSNMHNDYADRKNGRQGVTFFHEDAQEILGRTYGLMIFQEQAMQIAQKFAGYSMAEADGLRKIIGKKLVDKMAAEKTKFVSGCIAQGYTEELADLIFSTIESFASYAFNASHAYGYAYTSYQTAYLKANYPKEYMAALCSSVADKIEKSAGFLNEANKMGIHVATPNINKSQVLFSSDDEGIRVGLAAVKHVGEDFSTHIVSEREKGQFTSIIDFVQRVDPNSGQLTSLALAGAFDKFGTRLGISSVAGDILVSARKAAKKVFTGQESMFDTEELWAFEIPSAEFPSQIKLEHERESIGIYVSGHPLDSYNDSATDYMVADLLDVEQNGSADVLVQLSTVTPRQTRAGQTMANVVVGDQTGFRETVCFPRDYGKISPTQGTLGIATIKIGAQPDGERSYILSAFEPIHVEDEDYVMAQYMVYLPTGFAQDEGAVSKLKGILLSHYGRDNVTLYVSNSTRLELPDDIKIEASAALTDELRDLFQAFSSR